MNATIETGSTLAELLVAALVLQLGLLAAVSLTSLAQRRAVVARGTERVVSVAAHLADSLALADSVSTDSVTVDGVTARWLVPPGRVELRVWAARSDTVVVDVRLRRATRVH